MKLIEREAYDRSYSANYSMLLGNNESSEDCVRVFIPPQFS